MNATTADRHNLRLWMLLVVFGMVLLVAGWLDYAR